MMDPGTLENLSENKMAWHTVSALHKPRVPRVIEFSTLVEYLIMNRARQLHRTPFTMSLHTTQSYNEDAVVY